VTVLKWVLFSLIIILLLAAVGIGWYFSNTILTPRPYSLMPEFTILEVSEDAVTLPLPSPSSQFADTRKQGVYGLLWDTGSGRLGDVIEEGADYVTRPFELLEGQMPEPGAPARLNYDVYRSNPLSAHGLAFEEVTLEGEVGELKAWWLEGGDVAVLMLHGRRRSDRSETLRIMPTLVEQGYSVLALAYRNHDESDPSPDGFYHYGATEWQDAVTALQFLREQGIEQVVLYGFSYGGLVALETAEALSTSETVDIDLLAVILDSPLVDPRTVVSKGARDMGLPLADTISAWALWVAGQRANIDWSELDQRQSVEQLTVPILLIHGTDDATVPVSLAEELTERARAPLQFEQVPGAAHAEAWNRGPEAYETWVRDFLQQYAPLPSPPGG
jgi:pimeloyl-ACP methyl ester carboxylesterase